MRISTRAASCDDVVRGHHALHAMAAWQMLLPVLDGVQGLALSGVFPQDRDLCGDSCREASILEAGDDGWMNVCEMVSDHAVYLPVKSNARWYVLTSVARRTRRRK